MIRVARHTDYAARLLLDLAGLGEGASASISDIAKRRLLPVPFTRRMVARLVSAGILITTRGSKGGIQLGRPASAITLADVVTAMEGPILLNDCLHPEGACPFMRACPVQQAWVDTSSALTKHLSSFNLTNLLTSTKGHAAAHEALKAVAKGGTRKRRAHR